MRSAAPAMHKGPETEMTQTYSVSETLFEDARTLTCLVRVFHRDSCDRAGAAGPVRLSSLGREKRRDALV
jgi:hypothetical protein